MMHGGLGIFMEIAKCISKGALNLGGSSVEVMKNSKRVIFSFVLAGLAILSITLILPFGFVISICADAVGFPFLRLLVIIPIFLWWKLFQKCIQNRQNAIYFWGKRPLPQSTSSSSGRSKDKNKKLIIHCPKCGRSLKGAKKDMVGDTGVCLKCKEEFTIEGNNNSISKDSQGNC